MSRQSHQSWGRYPEVQQQVLSHEWRSDPLPNDAAAAGGSFLPYGNGRSYGDVCLNDGGWLLDCRGLDRFVAFDSGTGVLRCEAGVLLSEILSLAVPRGWFLPVSPGTRLVTLGGAIANDVHGKNHHRAGSFGCHVSRFELLRSDGTRLECSKEQNSEWFAATIGGLGLTGVIVWAEIQLTPIVSSLIDQDVVCYDALSDFFQLSRESDRDYEYTVAWVDCLARGSSTGRGVLFRGNHSKQRISGPRRTRSEFLSVPLDPPFSLVNRFAVRAFNQVYFHAHRVMRNRRRSIDYEPFFYPLDWIRNWNRIYGSRGFMQYQCVIPLADAEAAIGEMLSMISDAGRGSFLSVLKIFGDRPSPGLLSFPRPGATLALDFPNSDDGVLKLLERLDSVTRTAAGAVYPGKDARMSAANFQRFYPQWEALVPFIDPSISSSFWRRVSAVS